MEFVQRDMPSETHAKAVDFLKQPSNIFPLNDQYQVHGEGTGPLVAIKVSKQNAFNDRDGIQFYALRELMILQRLQISNFVVRLLDSFLFDGQVCIVMEYLPEEINQAHISNLLKGLQEIHDLQVCHRDLKPSNVRLSSDGQLRFLDFGISKVMPADLKTLHTKNCVTRCYRPPEIFFGDRVYTNKVDIWSAACVIFELVSGKILF